MTNNIDIILIRGAPGVGKTTIGRLFRESTPSGVVVDIDDVRRMVSSEVFLYGANVDYRKAVTATCALVAAFLDTGYSPIIVVDVFSPPILELFRRICTQRRTVVITFYSEDGVLARRMARRTSGYINLDVAIKINRLMKHPSDSSDVWIDTSTLGPAEVFAETQRRLSALGHIDRGSATARAYLRHAEKKV